MTFQPKHNTNQGRKHSAETRHKISIANKGRIFSDEWRENLSKAHKGQISWRKGRVFVSKEDQEKKRQIYIKMWRSRNKIKLAQQAREYGRIHRAKRSTQARVRYQENPQRILDRVRLRKYGITGEEFRKIVKEQKGKCSICLVTVNKNLTVDHDHITKKVRGVICNGCNLAIGNAKESPKVLRLIALYLEKYL